MTHFHLLNYAHLLMWQAGEPQETQIMQDYWKIWDFNTSVVFIIMIQNGQDSGHIHINICVFHHSPIRKASRGNLSLINGDG